MAAKEEQSKDKKAGEEKPPAKSGKKLIIIGGIVLVAVVVIGLAVFFFMRSRGGDGEEAEAATETKHAAAKKPAIYPLESFVVNIHDGPNLRYLKVKLEFEIPAAPEAKEELDHIQAPLRDAILVLLSSKNLEDITMTDGKNKLRDEVMATVAKVAPQGKVSRVYFTDFVVQ